MALILLAGYRHWDDRLRFWFKQQQMTVAEQRAKNIHVHEGISEAQFVEMRTQRDATLEMPALILPAVQINIGISTVAAESARCLAMNSITSPASRIRLSPTTICCPGEIRRLSSVATIPPVT